MDTLGNGGSPRDERRTGAAKAFATWGRKRRTTRMWPDQTAAPGVPRTGVPAGELTSATMRATRTGEGDAMTSPLKDQATVVLDVRGLRWASEQNVVVAVLHRRPGVLDVEVNPVAQ